MIQILYYDISCLKYYFFHTFMKIYVPCNIIISRVIIVIYFQMSAEEEHRRQIRRERNKLAAARCRKRRMDHTNELVAVCTTQNII